MRRQLDEHIRPPAWVGLAAGTAPASYFRLIRHGTAPPEDVADTAQLGRSVEGPARVDVQLSGDVGDLTPAVRVALHRIAGKRRRRHAAQPVIR